ncbi:MAG: DegV family protein [Acidobacteriota bacterium]
MIRNGLLLFHPEAEARQALGIPLAGCGFEVVPAADLAEAERFFHGLSPFFVVAPKGALPSGSSWLDAVHDGALRREVSPTWLDPEAVAVGDTVTLSPPSDAGEGGDPVPTLATGGLDLDRTARRLTLALLARHLGMEGVEERFMLVGSLALHPMLEVLRDLSTLGFNGRVEIVDHGSIWLRGGTPTSATEAPTRGVKAFCRLARHQEGALRIFPSDPRSAADAPSPDISEDLETLILAAIQDSLGERPDPRARLVVVMGDDFFGTQFSELQQRILAGAQRSTTVAEILDALEDVVDSAAIDEILALREDGHLVLKAPKAPVTIVTDSTSDLSPDMAKATGIVQVPLSVTFGDRRYLDRVDLPPRLFYQLLSQGKEHPESSPPNTEAFLSVYGPALERGDVISLHISSALSKTKDHAAQAATEMLSTQAFYARHLEVVDSRQVSSGLGLMALVAARLSALGGSAEQIADRLRLLRDRIHVLFAVDDLDYLVKGGRLSRTRGFVGSMLGIKPILGLEHGAIVPLDRVRGGRAVQPKMIEILRNRVEDDRPLWGFVTHSSAPVWAEALRRRLRAGFPIAELGMTEIGPVVGTHAGPGTVGLAVFQPTDEEMELLGLRYGTDPSADEVNLGGPSADG